MRHLSLFLAAAGVSFAQPAIRSFDLETIQRLGTAIYEQDIRVARASDMLFAQKIAAQKEGLRGWIVEGDPVTMLVRFVRELDGKLEAFADIQFSPTREPKLERPADTTLPPGQLARYRARQLATENIKRPCSPRYNVVILPDPERDGLLVYALAATTDANSILVGGHYRFSVSKDGEKIMQADELFRSCLTLPKNQPIPKGAVPAALYMTTLVSDTPLEIHVFLGLLHKLPFVVGTPDSKVWSVDAGRIARVK